MLNRLYLAPYHILWAPLFLAFAAHVVPRSAALVLALVFGLYALFSFRIERILKTALAMCLLPSEPSMWLFNLLILQILLIIWAKRGLASGRVGKSILFLGAWCVFSALQAQHFDLNVVSLLLFGATFCLAMVPFGIGTGAGLTDVQVDEIIRFFLGCLVLQSLFICYIALKMWYATGNIIVSDWATGSAFFSLPFLLACGIFYLIGPTITVLLFRSTSRPRSLDFVRIIVAGLLAGCLYLTGVKIIIYGSLIAVGVGLAIPILFVRDYGLFYRARVLVVGGSLAVGSVVGSWTLIHRAGGPEYMTAWVDGRIGPGGVPMHHKYLFLQRALKDIPQAYDSLLMGTGPGTVGSRASNLRAYDTMYKAPSQYSSISQVLSPYTSPAARAYYSDLYQKPFAIVSRYRSSTLSSPFSSLISILVELGVIGTVLCAGLVYHILRRFFVAGGLHARIDSKCLCFCVYFSTILLVIAACFDTYLERPTLMTAYWCLLGLGVSRDTRLMHEIKEMR